ncbi:APC family permease [Streptomyces sp. NPDC054796]
MPGARAHTPHTPHTAATADDGLKRTLTLRDLIVYGLLFIAPMAPVGVFGALDAKSHGVVPLVYVVATVAMAFTAYSYTRMVRAVPQAGSVYAYARTGLGEGAGFVAGWMAMLDYLLIPAVGYLFSGIAMNQLVPSVDQWIWTAAAVVITTALNLSGVRRAAAVGFVVLALEIVVLLVFVVAALVVLAQHGPARGWLSPFTGDQDFSLVAVLSAVSVAVLSFLGFDAIANFAEETVSKKGGAEKDGSEKGGKGAQGRDGSSVVAKALLGCLLLAGVLFLAQTYLAALLSSDSSRDLARDPAAQGSAFYVAVESAVGGWLQTTVAASKAVGAAFAALAGQAAAGRLLYAMARDRRLPRALSKVDAGTGTPRRTLLLTAVITLCAAVWAARTPDGLDRLVSVVDIGALTAFALLHLSVIGYYGVRKRDGAAGVLRDWVLPLAGLAITVAVIVTAHRDAHLVGLAWLAAALVILAVLRARKVTPGSGGSGGGGGAGQ